MKRLKAYSFLVLQVYTEIYGKSADHGQLTMERVCCNFFLPCLYPTILFAPTGSDPEVGTRGGILVSPA